VLEDLRLLVELQEIDQKVYELKKDRERLPVLVARAGEVHASAQAEAKSAQAEVDAAVKEKKAVDSEIQQETARLDKMKQRSSEIKNNKEYYAHLKEIEDCQKKITSLEDRTLELMEKAEKSEALLKEKKEALAVEQVSFEEEKTRIEKTFESGEAMLKELKQKRKAVLPKISKAAAEYYAQALKRYPDSAIVETVGGSCTGCRMMMPPQQYNNVRKGETVITCNNCNRILYFRG